MDLLEFFLRLVNGGLTEPLDVAEVLEVLENAFDFLLYENIAMHERVVLPARLDAFLDGLQVHVLSAQFYYIFSVFY